MVTVLLSLIVVGLSFLALSVPALAGKRLQKRCCLGEDRSCAEGCRTEPSCDPFKPEDRPCR